MRSFRRVRDRQQPARGAPRGGRSSSTRPSRRRRSGSSTCARSRRSGSSSCPRRPTSRASCAPTPSTSASTGSSTSTSSTRASSRARTPTRGRAAPRCGPSGATGRLETNVVLLALAVVAIVTVVVISAWQSSGSSDPPAKPPPRHAAHRPQKATRSPSPHAVPRDHGGQGRLVRRRPPRPGPAAGCSSRARSRKGRTEPFNGKQFWLSVSSPENLVVRRRRQERSSSPGGKPVDADGHPERGAAGLSAALPRRRSSSPARSSCAATATTCNGPFLAGSLLGLGIEPAELRIVGDVPGELEAALRGGPRPRPARRSPAASGRRTTTGRSSCSRGPPGAPLVLDAALEARDRGALAGGRRARMRRPYADFADGVRKQATVPEGAIVAGLAGTAPALVLELDGCRRGGPSRAAARAAGALAGGARDGAAAAAARRGPASPERRVLRFYGVGESAVAQALAAAGGDGDGVEVTICARDFEIHVDLFVEPGAEARADELESALVEPIARVPVRARPRRRSRSSCSTLCRERGLTLATAESCTGGLVAARLTSVPGSSDVFVGRRRRLRERGQGGASSGCPRRCSRAHGAVSAETAAAMARGARERLGGGSRRLGHGHRRARRAARRRSRSGSSTCARQAPAGELASEFVVPGDRRDGPGARDRRRAPPPARDLSQSRERHVTLLPLAWPAVNVSASSAPSAFRTRRSSASPAGRRRELRGGRTVTAREPARHARLPRLAGLQGRCRRSRPLFARRPRARAASGWASAATARRGASAMLTFDDEGGRATALAVRLHGALEALGVYRPRGEAVASAPHGPALPGAAPARPAAARARRGRSVRCRCLQFRAASGRSAVRGCRGDRPVRRIAP